jgi:hypothetical protein
MPSWTHEGLVQLFADRLELTAELLGALGLTLRGPFRRVDADLTDLSPAELHADLVLRSDARPARAVIVEVQLQIDAGKRWSWPAYVALLRARERCDVTLVVVAIDARVAAWCAESFELTPGVQFAPVVLGPSRIPSVVDVQHACDNLELSLLSALAHPETAVLDATFAALEAAQDEGRAAIYTDILIASVAAARTYWEKMMQPRKYEFQTEFARKYVAMGREEGREECREETLREVLLRLLEVRFDGASAQMRARIEAADTVQLQGWLDRGYVVDSAAAVFGEG